MTLRMLAIASTLLIGAGAHGADESPDPRDSVVYIEARYRAPDLFRPWTRDTPSDFSGTGFIIGGNRILTNAHVAEFSREIYVRPHGSSDRYLASVTAIAEGPDIAILELRDKDRHLFEERPALRLAPELPDPGDTVRVYGFPRGGKQLSTTEGVVSRVQYMSYSSGHGALSLQIDAAVNPGNSGGPAFVDDQVIGMVYSYIPDAENIGYIIPTVEIRRFMEDVEDGRFDGPTVFRDGLQTVENSAVRRWLKLPDGVNGMMITRPFIDDPGYALRERDVITAVGGYEIDSQGLVELRPGLRVRFLHVIDEVATDDVVPMTIYRDGVKMDVKVDVGANRRTLFPFLGCEYPDYFILGPLVFSPAYADYFSYQLDGEYLATISSPLADRFGERPAFPGEQLVVSPSPLFSHPLSKGYEIVYCPVLRSVNGVEIRNIEHLLEVVHEASDEYLVFEWYGESQETLVFDREELERSTDDILEENGIRHRMSPGLREVWEGEE